MSVERVDVARLRMLLEQILQHDGCTDEETAIVAEHLIEASLRGHDSHGVIRILRYHHWLETGRIHAGRELQVISDSGTMLHVDGHSGMGQRLARDATVMGIERARRHGVALVALRQAGHIGRLGAYAEQACEAGLVSIHFVNVAGSRLVAPFGSAQRCLSTAPIAIGVPNAEGGHFVLDFATSLVAEGKALIAARGGKPLPKDALIDADGQRTVDPAVLYGETVAAGVPDPRAGPGALRTMGEHKGSGLALACELLAGALTGNGTNGPAEAPFGNGLLSILIDPARLVDGAGFGGGFVAEVADFVTHIRNAAPERDVDFLMDTAATERERRAERLAHGLPMPKPVIDEIVALGRHLEIAFEELEVRT